MRFGIYGNIHKKAREVLSSDDQLIFAIGERSACLLFTSKSFIFCQGGLKPRATVYPIKEFNQLNVIPKGAFLPGKYVLSGKKIGMPGTMSRDYVNLIQKIQEGLNSNEFEVDESITKDINSVDEGEHDSNDLVSREIYAEMDFVSEEEMLSIAQEITNNFKSTYNKGSFEILEESQIDSVVDEVQTYQEKLGQIIDNLCKRNPDHPQCIRRKNEGKSYTVVRENVLLGTKVKSSWYQSNVVLVTLYEVVLQESINKTKATRINIFDFYNTEFGLPRSEGIGYVNPILFEGKELMAIDQKQEYFDMLNIIKSDIIRPLYIALKEQINERKRFISEDIIELGKKNFMSAFDIDGDGKIDVIHENAFTDTLDVKKAELSKFTNDVIHDFARIKEYLNKVGRNCETLLEDIINIDYEEFRSNPDFLTTGLESLAQQIHNYSIMSVVGIKMISNAIEGNMVDYYGLRNIFEQVGVFLSYAEAQQIEKLNVISKTLEKTTDSILQLQSSSNRIQSILLQNQEATNKAMSQLGSQLSSRLNSIGKASKVNNVYNAVNTAQLFRISKKIK